ncbi:chromosomal replication initiator protein DnaA [Candidatus Falkowbacteria bacterium]|nr:chromosomal replication initiator protein DnaA [Candidatus Falkowbacteria bacterium]
MNNKQLWQAVLGELEVTLSKANFTTWFKGTFIIDVNSPKVIIGVPNAFTKSWLENKYQKEIVAAIRKIMENDSVKLLEFRVESIKNEKIIDNVEELARPKEVVSAPKTSGFESPTMNSARLTVNNTVSSTNQYGLNPRYTFDNFIVGKGNELARAAAEAVAAHPGTAYNPLFIYGPAGLGKTHLMQAIGNQIAVNDPTKRVLYITCEKFTNDFINSVSTGKAAAFKDIYRSVDVLLIDDIQFLSGKEQTQEEFFHTFNTLHQNNKQVVITSDRSPKSIAALENRLLTRFEWGMITDINQPDLETRKAILKMKAFEKKYNLSEEILDYIAGNISSNVRELEGALNRLIAYHQLNNVVLSVGVAQQVLSSVTTNIHKKVLTTKDVITIVSSYYDVPVDEILGKCRSKNLVIPRQIIMYLMRNEMECSFPTIGIELGGRDHTTAMHACTKIQKDYTENEKIRRQIEQIKEKLYA